jgi:hypothetical protein
MESWTSKPLAVRLADQVAPPLAEYAALAPTT